MRIINSSNGVYIKGTIPMPVSSVDFKSVARDNDSNQEYINSWKKWWEQSPSFSSTNLLNHWSAARPRANVSKVLASIRELMKSDLPWFPIVQDELNKILYLDGNVNSQLGPRIFRSAFLKLAIVISRQCMFFLIKIYRALCNPLS